MITQLCVRDRRVKDALFQIAEKIDTVVAVLDAYDSGYCRLGNMGGVSHILEDAKYELDMLAFGLPDDTQSEDEEAEEAEEAPA